MFELRNSNRIHTSGVYCYPSWSALLKILSRVLNHYQVILYCFEQSPILISLGTHLIDNPWNGKLVHMCLMMVLGQKITCTHPAQKLSGKGHEGYACAPICYTRIDDGLLRLVFLVYSLILALKAGY